jgi:hypothetical protein
LKAKPIWAVAILFTIIGFVLPAAGAFWHPIVMLVGVPFSLLGWLLLGLLSYGEHVRRTDPARYPPWLWWTNLIGGIAGVAVFAIPALFVFPAFLLLGMREFYLLGALFTLLGLIVGAMTVVVAAYMIRNRPKEFEHPEEPDSQWETEAYRRWLDTDGDEESSREAGSHDT